MTTKKSDVIRALRAQIDSVKAGSGDKLRIRALLRTIRDIRGADETPEERQTTIRDAFTEVKDMEANAAAFDEAQMLESMTLLVSRLGELPETGEPGVMTQLRVRNKLRKVVDNTTHVSDELKEKASEWLERFFGDTRPNRPVEKKLTGLLAALTGGELSGEKIAAITGDLERLQERFNAASNVKSGR